MEKLSWSYEDLMNCPYEKYLDYTRILSLEAKHQKKQEKKQKNKIK